MKKVIILIFSVLIIVSVIVVNCFFAENPVEDDIFGDSFNTFFQILFNVFILVPEIDWFYNTLYFMSPKKTKRKTIINIMSGICSVMMALSLVLLASFLLLGELLMILSFGTYVLLRIIYVVVTIAEMK